MRYRTAPRVSIECAHCGETKTVEQSGTARPIYCSPTCKRNAGVKRRKQRRREERREERVPCPLPGKMRYASQELADREAEKQPTRTLRPYLCTCGDWHLSSMDAIVGDN